MSSNYARNVSHRAAKPSQNIYSDNTPSSPFDDDEDYVVVSTQIYDDMPPFRPSLGSSADHHYSETDHSRISYDALIPGTDQSTRYDPYQQQQFTMEAERRPLTSNELNPVERAALVRQSRKLNKILGTTPHIVENNQPSSSRNAPNKLQRRGTLAGSDIRLDRSASMATLNSPPLDPPSVSQWSKPASSLIAKSSPGANAKAPVLQLNVAPSSGPGVEMRRQRRLSDSSVASSLLSVPAPRHPGSGRVIARRQETTDSVDDSQVIPPSSENANNSSRLNVYIPASPTSPPYVSDSTRRQQTRARMAKIQQIMGESVPSELVMGTNSNKVRRRRLSMESPTTPTLVTAKSLQHKRSKSLWKNEIDNGLDFDSAPENSGNSKSKTRAMPPIEDLLLKQLQDPMNEQQKALNVKRALKMVAVFGVPPPQALYQDIPGPGPSGSLDPSVSRQSLASLAYMLDHDRDSLYDLLASTKDSDSEFEDDPVEWPYERKPRSDSLPEARGKSPIGATKFSVTGTHPDMCPPTPPFTNHSRASSKPVSSRVPPLVYSRSVTTLSGEDKKPKSGSRSKGPSSTLDRQFAARRRRAKKLSRFFGVGYNHLFNTLVYEEGLGNRQEPGSPPIPLLPAEISRTDTMNAATSSMPPNLVAALAPSAYRGTGRGGTVLVQTDNGKKATVLRTSTNMAADVDANDLGEMMARLRALRA